MKKNIFTMIFLMIIFLNSIACANPIDHYQYYDSMGIFTKLRDYMGETGSFVFGLIITIIMCIVIYIIVLKSFDLKNKPENKTKAKIVCIIVTVIIIAGFVPLGIQKYESIMMAQRDEANLVRGVNYMFELYYGSKKSSATVKSLFEQVRAYNLTTDRGHISIKFVNLDEDVVLLSGDSIIAKNILKYAGSFYDIEAYDNYPDGIVKTIIITARSAQRKKVFSQRLLWKKQN